MLEDKLRVPTQCKFCRKMVLYDKLEGRVLEIDGKTPHVQNCPRRQAHFKNRAAEFAERRRHA